MKRLFFVDPDLLATTDRIDEMHSFAMRHGGYCIVFLRPSTGYEPSYMQQARGAYHACWKTWKEMDGKLLTPGAAIKQWIHDNKPDPASTQITVISNDATGCEEYQLIHPSAFFSDTEYAASPEQPPRAAFLVGPARVIDSNSMTVEDAIAEAQRQAKKNPGKLFQVVAVVAQCIGEVEVKTTNHPVA